MPESLPTVEAYWSSPYSVDVWARLLTFRTDVEFIGADSDEAIVLGPVLPSSVEPRVAEGFALRDRDKNLIWWTLSIRPPPDGLPPANVQETDTRLGGRDGLVRLVSESNNAATMCEYRIQTRFQASEWSCAVLPRSADTAHADAPIHRLGPSACIESIGYRFADQDDGITELHITYHPKQHDFFVQLLARGRLTLNGSTWLPGAEDFLRAAKNTLFARKQGGVT